MPAAVTREAATRLSGDQARVLLVDAAMTLLAQKGPSELKARSVAELAGVSTTAVYYHIGGMPELLQAVVDHAFRQLDSAFDESPVGTDPVSDLFAMALSARQLAQRNPHLYDLMFGLSTRGTYRSWAVPPSAGRSEAFRTTYAHLVEPCRRLLESGRVRPDPSPEDIADQLWSCVHGFVTLELGGHFAHRADPLREVLLPMTVNVLVGLGDDPQSCRDSHLATLESRDLE